MLRGNGVELNCSDSEKVIQCAAILFLLANEVVFMMDQKNLDTSRSAKVIHVGKS